MDLSKLSVAELSALKDKVSALIEKHEKKDREAAIEQIYAIAHSLGMPLKAIFQGAPPTLTKQTRAGKRYQDPANPANTWGGIGPRPPWLKAALAAGVTLEGLRA